MNNKCFKGYGVLLNGSLVWSQEESENSIEKPSLSLAELVRDRDYPDASVVFWVQSKSGSETVTTFIS